MLRQRVVTGLILVLMTLGAVFLLPKAVFSILVLCVILSAAYEWTRLAGPSESLLCFFYLFIVAVVFSLGWAFVIDDGMLPWFLVSVVWWAVVSIMLVSYHPDMAGQKWVRPGLQIAGVITLVPAGLALIQLRETHASLLVFLFLIVWVADSAAYFTGKYFGKTKLSPDISPGKTREGVVGGLLAIIPLALLGSWILELPLYIWVYFLVLSLFVAIASIIGDLFESLLKRIANVKDSGTMLPGHGGVLDRIDSITAAAPLFVIGLYWMNYLP